MLKQPLNSPHRGYKGQGTYLDLGQFKKPFRPLSSPWGWPSSTGTNSQLKFSTDHSFHPFPFHSCWSQEYSPEELLRANFNSVRSPETQLVIFGACESRKQILIWEFGARHPLPVNVRLHHWWEVTQPLAWQQSGIQRSLIVNWMIPKEGFTLISVLYQTFEKYGEQ